MGSRELPVWFAKTRDGLVATRTSLEGSSATRGMADGFNLCYNALFEVAPEFSHQSFFAKLQRTPSLTPKAAANHAHDEVIVLISVRDLRISELEEQVKYLITENVRIKTLFGSFK